MNNELKTLMRDAERDLGCVFRGIGDIANFNTAKVMEAFAKNRVSDTHFMPTSGYGYGDTGRDVLDRVFADSLGAEDAIVRHTLINGTHAIATALFGLLRPGDTLLSLSGDPYDTLRGVIGMDGQKNGSLAELGVSYAQIELDDPFYEESLVEAVKKYNPKAALLQRSGGYSMRPALDVSAIGRIIALVREVRPDTIIIVDNCYGEFTERCEPTSVGADIICGSLIKNPGGGLAQTGGYIAGRADLVELISHRVTVPGIGREAGCSMDFKRMAFQGFFLAPHVVAQAMKTAVFCARVMELSGFETNPAFGAPRSDIIQRVIFKKPEPLLSFIRGIQQGSPVDSFVTPEPWNMPGYNHQVVMAAGTFVQGASIELSADAPMKEPYCAYIQGGLTYESGRLGILRALANVLKK